MNRKRTSLSILVVIAAALILTMIVFLKSNVPYYVMDKAKSMDGAIWIARPEAMLRQDLELNAGNDAYLKAFYLWFDTSDRINRGIVHIALFVNDDLIQHWDMDARHLRDEGNQIFKLNEGLKIQEGGMHILIFRNPMREIMPSVFVQPRMKM